MNKEQWSYDQLKIRAAIEKYCDACCRRNADELMKLWADDCVWSVPDMEGLERVEGKERIREIWTGAQALFPFAFLYAVPGHIELDGDHAVARCYTHEILEDTEGKVRHAVGRYDDKLVRSGTEWLFAERVWYMLYHL